MLQNLQGKKITFSRFFFKIRLNRLGVLCL
jgi:hypothetical protein